jgi:hypothetical protein
MKLNSSRAEVISENESYSFGYCGEENGYLMTYIYLDQIIWELFYPNSPEMFKNMGNFIFEI